MAHARAVLAAVDAQRRWQGTAVLPDGRFADRAMVEVARRVLALAAHTGA